MSENTGDAGFITLRSYPRAIAHIDGDAFFASCEQAKDPSLKGRPLVTGKERGIISCASYEAKAFGVTRGITLAEAKRLCPALVVLPSDYETYSIYAERLFAIIRRFTPSVEEYSIDEAFGDLTGLRRLYRTSYPEIARMIKEAVREELGLTVSVGLSLTKTLAKLCSGHRKPDGLTALPGHRLHAFLEGVELGRVCGFGPNTVELLRKCGVRDVLGYVRRPRAFAERLLGKAGVELWQELRGIPVYGLSEGKKEKYLSISKTKTFSPASSDRATVKAQLMRNLEAAFIKLRRHRLSAKALAVYLKRADFSGTGSSGELDRHSSSTLDFTALGGALFEAAFEKGVFYRATGVVLSGITADGIDTRTLFDDPARIAKIRALSRAVDTINEAYGKYAVHLASSGKALSGRPAHPRNAAAWRKTALLKGDSSRCRLKIPLLRLGGRGQ